MAGGIHGRTRTPRRGRPGIADRAQPLSRDATALREAGGADQRIRVVGPRTGVSQTRYPAGADRSLCLVSAGAAEQDAGHKDAAWECWRQSLQLSDRHLPDILHRLGDKPDAQAVAERLLPDNPEMLVKAARTLYPEPEDASAREPLLRGRWRCWGNSGKAARRICICAAKLKTGLAIRKRRSKRISWRSRARRNPDGMALRVRGLAGPRRQAAGGGTGVAASAAREAES